MATVTLELDDKVAAVLSQRAEAAGLTLAELIASDAACAAEGEASPYVFDDAERAAIADGERSLARGDLVDHDVLMKRLEEKYGG